MGREAKKYVAYARECARQADEATSADRRDRLLELSRVWMVAALMEADGEPQAEGARGPSR
jgi:hypothetical protein